MESFQQLREDAKKKIQIADHMLIMTYQVVNDPKLLIAVLENVLQSIHLSIQSVLAYERLFKRIPPYPGTLEGQLMVIKQKLAKKYELTEEDFKLISAIKTLLQNHKSSPIEFIRNNKFVISDDSYNLKTLSMNDMKQHISKTKQLVHKLYAKTTENDRLFR